MFNITLCWYTFNSDELCFSINIVFQVARFNNESDDLHFTSHKIEKIIFSNSIDITTYYNLFIIRYV